MVVGRVISSVAQRQVRYVTPVSANNATGLVSTVYGQIADEMRLVVPPALLHSPAPDLLAAYWMLMREPLLPTVTVTRAVKEAVAAVVSVANTCPYCAEMHSIGLYDLSTEQEAEAVLADRLDEVVDPRVRSVAEWARTAHRPGTPGGEQPFPAADRPELVGVAVSFHYLTRMVNVFLSSFLLPPGLRPASRRRAKRGISRVLRPTLRGNREAGRSVPLLPDAPLPADAGWAVGNPSVEAAVARSYAAYEAAGERSVPSAVRDVVRARLADWRGEDTGMSRRWVEPLVAGLPEAHRAAGRVALLTAVASYQVDEEEIAAFRRAQPDDRALVETVAWASFAAARQVGSWQVPATSGTAPRTQS
ncbi:alkyl hydroperoxide reductase AhpD [Longispora fulva]|uniref:AhpD family alkylhydroperoxidase n=1 Tax=Longispora fulva TaxID=619741 RepID=A0A8J7KGI2_9ACTN|nr:carboxymuconolactone decarboxylase family protein [Longispora fulva]MBG6134974.1 AhpD family alkylhydroperoxidase [Longispora fulva]GIG56794.1 alkyl hydroperoxide reductase AhpD [Longispora fulva]